jgi:hypothetical protein
MRKTKTRKIKINKNKNKKRKGGKSLRKSTLSIPTNGLGMLAKGESKTVWQLKGRPYAVINANLEQMGKTTHEKQEEEYHFSKLLSIKYPLFFPEVYHLDLDENTKEESDVLDTMAYTPTDKLKFIWVKEVCNPPSINELRGNYLEKAIRLLINLMKKGICYTDIKHLNVGIRGNDYVIIDTSPEDTYYIPEQYQLDYLKGEIIVCCTNLYFHLSRIDDPSGMNKLTWLKIKRIFMFLCNNHLLERTVFMDKLKQFLQNNNTDFIEDKELKIHIIHIVRFIFNKYMCTEDYCETNNCTVKTVCPIRKINEFQKEYSDTPVEIVSIQASFMTYLSGGPDRHLKRLIELLAELSKVEDSSWNAFNPLKWKWTV